MNDVIKVLEILIEELDYLDRVNKCAAEDVYEFFQDGSVNIRLIAAERCKLKHLPKLCYDESTEVRLVAVKRCNKDLLITFMDDPSKEVVDIAIKRFAKLHGESYE